MTVSVASIQNKVSPGNDKYRRIFSGGLSAGVDGAASKPHSQMLNLTFPLDTQAPLASGAALPAARARARPRDRARAAPERGAPRFVTHAR